MDDFEDIRLKEVADLTDDDKAVLKERFDDLTDDEKTIFKDISVEGKKEEEKKEEFKFGSKEEFDRAIEERTEQILADREKAKEEESKKAKAEPTSGDRFFPEGYQAKDWEEAAREMYPKFRERIFKEQEAVKSKTQEAIDRINQEFDTEIETIAAEDKTIPAKGTEERSEFETELSKIGLEYQGVTNMTQAYKIWKALNSGKEEKQNLGTKQKDLASKVGRSGGEGEPLKQRSYREISGRSMDDLIEADLEKLGVKT